MRQRIIIGTTGILIYESDSMESSRTLVRRDDRQSAIRTTGVSLVRGEYAHREGRGENWSAGDSDPRITVDQGLRMPVRG